MQCIIQLSVVAYRDEQMINILNQLNSMPEISKHKNTTISPVPVRIQNFHVDLGEEIDVDQNMNQACTTPSTLNQHHHDLGDRKQTSCDLSKYCFHHDNNKNSRCEIMRERHLLFSKHKSLFLCMHQSLEQAIITSMFTTAQHIQVCHTN